MLVEPLQNPTKSGDSAQTRIKRVYVEISNICNLQCSFCPEVGRSKQELSPGEFTATLEKIGPHTDEIYLHLMGEPLNHSCFDEIIAICARCGIATKVTTNGTLLTAARAALLLNPVVKQVNISLHSFTDNFPGRKVTGYFDKIFTFVREATHSRPDLYINLRLWDLSEERSGRPENLESRRLIETEFQVDLSKQTPDIRRRKGLVLVGRTTLHFDSRFVWPSLDLPFLSKQGRCQGLLSHVGIHADGTVVPCCLDKEAVLPLGNIRTTSFEEIMNSPRAISMRRGFERGELVEELCQKCSFARRFVRKSLPPPRVNPGISQESKDLKPPY